MTNGKFNALIVDYVVFPSLILVDGPSRSHPYFISKEAYKELVEGTGVMNEVKAEDWATETRASWRHTIWLGIKNPWGWISKPRRYMRCFRDGYCLERFHRAFQRGLMEYGMVTATKREAP